MSLEALAAFAVKSNNTAAAKAVPLSALSIEEARARVKIKDGNRKKSVDGSVALILTLGKKNLALDVIAPDATRVNATVDQVVDFTTQLQAAITAGSFDAEITRIQLESIEPAAVVAEVPAPSPESAEPAVAAVPAGVDLDDLG